MLELNYTQQGKRPSVRQVLADWKKAGKPTEFSVDYGESFAHFELYLGRWVASGNGCRGIDRDSIEKQLQADEKKG